MGGGENSSWLTTTPTLPEEGVGVEGSIGPSTKGKEKSPSPVEQPGFSLSGGKKKNVEGGGNLTGGEKGPLGKRQKLRRKKSARTTREKKSVTKRGMKLTLLGRGGNLELRRRGKKDNAESREGESERGQEQRDWPLSRQGKDKTTLIREESCTIQPAIPYGRALVKRGGGDHHQKSCSTDKHSLVL